MAFCRIKNHEQLKLYAPGEFGKMLGLDRIPEVGYLRKKINQILQQSLSDTVHKTLFGRWLSKLPELYFYIDGHIRIYHGKKANLSKKYVSREKLCLPGTMEFWVNDPQGMPMMVVTTELNEKLKQGINQAITHFNNHIGKPKDNNVRYTIVFDREGYEPKWFKSLWESHQVAMISYRKNVKDHWQEKWFKSYTLVVNHIPVVMQLCEMGVCLNGVWFREIRKLGTTGHQTAIITTNMNISIEQVAQKMFARWTQENYFKYMIENFDFDKMIEYGTQSINPSIDIPNPKYQQLTYRLKKLREKKKRLEARVYQKMTTKTQQTIETTLEQINNSGSLIESIKEYQNQIEKVIQERKSVKSRISIEQMPEQVRYNKLKQEGKKFKNIILMLAYRAESAMVNSIAPFYKNNNKDGRMIIKEIFQSSADIIPDIEQKTLTIRLHSLSTPRHNKVVKKLCEVLNNSQTYYPDTNLKLIYDIVAS